MRLYDPEYVPAPFGLANTGSICYFNALIQALASCPSFVESVLSNEQDSLSGKALKNFFSASVERVVASEAFPYFSSRILASFVTDLRKRRPNTRFGSGQECASEAFTLLIEMMGDTEQGTPLQPQGKDSLRPQGKDSLRPQGKDSLRPQGKDPLRPQGNAEQEAPLRPREKGCEELFRHTHRCTVYCKSCLQAVSEKRDDAIQMDMYFLGRAAPMSPDDFASSMLRHAQVAEDYRCERCEARGKAVRVYKLVYAPEIVVCLFDIYGFYHPRKTIAQYFPEELSFPSKTEGRDVVYRYVAQIEHFGSIHGGHYIARARRKNGRIYRFDDMSVTETRAEPTPNTYLVFYHVFEAPPEL